MSEKTRDGLHVNYNLGQFSLSQLNYRGENMSEISISGIVLPNEEGCPNLPVESRLLAIPQGAEARLNVINAESEIIRNVNIAPALRIQAEDEEPEFNYVKNRDVYERNAFYPEQPFTIDRTSIRGVDAVAVTVSPFQYNPVTKELKVYTNIELSVSYEGGNGHFGDDRLRSPYWDPILASQLMNYDQLPVIDYASRMQQWLRDNAEGAEYLIITPNNDGWAQYANQLRDYRMRQGILTKVYRLDEMPATTTTEMKTWFHNAYNTWDIPPVAVLLFGDHNSNMSQGIPAEYTYHSSSYGNCITDNFYADPTGDLLPDMVFSRLVAANASEAQMMVSKQLEYEYTNPNMEASTYDHPITALGWQTERWFQICSEAVGGYWRNQGKHPVRINAIYSGTPGSSWSSNQNTSIVVNYFGPNGQGYIPATPSELGGWTGGTGTQVVNAVNNGCMLLQHRDHGYYQGWGEPDFSNSYVNQMTNTGKLTFVNTINCQTGTFDYSSNCLIEAFMRRTYNGQNAGAVGCIGPTQTSYSFVNDTYVWGMYDQYDPNFLPDYGPYASYEGNWQPAFGNVAGKYFLQQSSWPYNASEKAITHKMFTAHCDAFLRLYTQVPQTMAVSHSSSVIAGYGAITVTAPEGCIISLVKANLDESWDILAVEEATGGAQVIEFEPQVPPTVINIVVTGQDYLRYEDTIDVVPAQGSYIVVDSYTPNAAPVNQQTSLSMSFKNVGLNATTGTTSVTLTSQDNRLTITDGTGQFGALGSNQVVTLQNEFSFIIAQDVPDNTKFYLDVTMTCGGHTWTGVATITAKKAVLEYVSMTWDGSIVPGETISVTARFKNTGHYMATNAVAQIATTSPYVTFGNIMYAVGTIEVGEQVECVFNVNVSSSSPDNIQIPLTFTLNADGGLVAEGSEVLMNTCDIVFKLHDSFGDGWNGNILNVSFSDGSPTQQLTLTSGSYTSYTPAIGDGTQVTLTWTASNWINECSFEVEYSNQVLIYKGTNLSSSFQHTFDLDCSDQFNPLTITTTASPQAGGTLTGAGSYNPGESCTITATPQGDYTFINWTENGTAVTTQTSYTFSVYANRAFVANFSLPLDVTVTANPTGGGTVTGGGTYTYGTSVTISAEPASGYVFKNWTKNGSVVSCLSSYTITVTETAEYVANFEQVDGIVIGDATYTNAYLPMYSYYSLTEQIYTSEEMGGANDISSMSFFNAGSTSITRNIDLYMVSTEKTSFGSTSDWIAASESDLVFSGNVTVSAYSWVTIYFDTPFEYDGTSNVAVIVDDNTNTYNAYTSGRVFETNESQAIRISGSGTNYDPTNPTYTGTLVSRKNQVVFGIANYQYYVSASVNPTNSGTVSGGGGPYYYGYRVTLTATPEEGYVFNNWTKDGEVVSYLSTYQFNVTETATYVANFEAIDGIAIGDATNTNAYLPTYYYNSLTEQIYTAEEMGNEPFDISSVSFFNTGSSRNRTLSVYMVHTDKTEFENDSAWIAVSQEDLVFSGSVTFSSNSWTTIYFGNLFEYDGVSNVALIVGDNSNNYNTYTSFRTFDTDESQAIRIYGYYGTNYDPTNPYSYTGTRMAVKNQVVFGIPNPQFTVTTTVNPTGAGTVSGGEGLFYLGQSCTLTATANPGYGFYYWKENGTIKSSSPVYTFPVMGNTQLEACFGEPFTITVTTNPTEGGTATGGGEYGYNQQCTLTATANEGYLFWKWTKNNSSSAVACLPTYTFSVTSDATYVAQFSQMDGIAIGEPTATSYFLPSYTSYPYSLTQQIYTAEELNSGACEISSVTFFNAGYGETRNLAVYMVNTDKASFSSTTDWIAVTEADKVFEGNFSTLYRNWSTLYFNTAFQYDGHSNVALIIDDNTNYWNGSTYCRTFETETTQAIRVYGSEQNYDPSNPGNYTGTLMSVKNQVVFGIADYQYYVSLSADPVEGGTVEGSGGPYFYGQPITITATPNEGYVFNYWTRYNEEYGYDEVVSYFSPDNLPVWGDIEYTAHFQQMDGIVIGEPVNTDYYLPAYTYYPYSLSQQIYTAAEMGGESKSLCSVSFFNTVGYGITHDLDIYLKNTNKTTFNNEYDWISVTEADKVFSGTVDIEGEGWTTIYFNTEFAYNSSYNLAMIVVDNTGYWDSEMLWRTFDTQNTQAVYAIGYDYPLDPSNLSNEYGYLVAEKNQVVFGSPSSYYTVTVSANPATGGTVSGGGGSYFYGQNITLTATANEGYVFDNWTKDGEVVSGSPIFVLSVTETANYVANFEQVNGTSIGSGTMTNAFLPTYSYYPYTLSQQIYTADEIGSGVDEISSVSFYNTGETITRNFTIYMANTDKTAFENNTDWITVAESDQVFSGNVTLTANCWTTINFGTIFEHESQSNVVLVVDDNSGSWYSGISCRTFATNENQAIRIYGYGTNYNPLNPTDYSGTLMSQKNQIILGTPQYNYTVSVSVNPANSGTVSGNEGLFYLGQNCTLTATANPGYCFYNWTLDGTVVSSSETYTFPVTGNMSLVANFGTPIAVGVSANPVEGGTITGGGNYAQGHTCTLTATANDKYVFINWTKDGSVVSWLSTYSFTVGNTATEYVANFQRIDNGVVVGDAVSTNYCLPSYTYYPYNLSQQIYTADEIGMECDIASVAFFNTSTTTPNRNFDVYLIQTDKSSFTGSYDWVTATEADRVFSGNVTVKGRDWTVITFNAPFHYDGTSNLLLVVDDNTASYGSYVYFRTYTANDYQSLYYYGSSTNFDPLNPTNYGYRTTAKNQVIFGFQSDNYTVTVSSDPSYAGSVSGGGTFASGQPCLVKATANEGYCFYNWTEDGEVVSTDAEYSFTVTSNRNLVAHFGTPVTITASASPEEGGTVSGEGSYAPGHICNLTATPNVGYTFISWTKDGEVVSYLSSYTFIVDGSADYVANFTPIYSSIAIGDAFGSNQYLPSNSYYNYSFSQQIYTTDEMGGANEISSIAFFNTGNTKTRNFTIYLKHTEKDAFNNNSDWIPVSYSDQVYYGSVTMTKGQWTYITLDVPFSYNGMSNLALIVDDNTGDFSYGLSCRVFAADGNQALQAFSDDLNYNPSSPSAYTGSMMSLKNQVLFGLSGNVFNITATANPTVGGSVTGGGVYQGGAICSLTATPADGYHFFCWKENGTVASMANPYEFTVESDRNLIAQFGQVTNHWTVNGSNYPDVMTITGVIQIDGVEQRSDLLEIGVFSGTECRGTQLASYFEITDRYLVWLTVYGANGEDLTFKIYDHRIGQELNLISPNLVFDVDGYGDPINPYILDFTSMVSIQQSLVQGWNWFSTYVEVENPIGMLQMLETSLGNKGIQIKNVSVSTEYDPEWGWFGDLDDVGMTNEEMVMIQTNSACTVELQGMPANPANHPITINHGWNWIGFPCNQSMSVNDAMSGFTPEANDQIKTRNQGYATYISYGSYHTWQGTLNTMEPGQGYMYKSNSNTPKTLIYQTNRSEMLLANITPENNIYVPSDEDFVENMTITAIIEVDGQELRSENYELAAFVGNECRGSVKLMYVEPFDRYVAFLTVYGEPSEELHFVLTDGWESAVSGDLVEYIKDGTIGTLTEPAVLHFGTLGVNDSEQVVVNVFPNPSNGIFNVEGNGIRKIEVIDALGQIVLSKEVEDDSQQINLSNRASGVYLLRVITDKGISTNQIIKK